MIDTKLEYAILKDSPDRSSSAKTVFGDDPHEIKEYKQKKKFKMFNVYPVCSLERKSTVYIR